MLKIYLLRHGQTDWNKQWRLQGRCDVPLNREGMEQIKNTCVRMKDLGERIDAILASPLCRARVSAEIAADALGFPQEKILTEPDLIERGFGEAEGTTRQERLSLFPGNRFPGMETEEAVRERAERVLFKCISQYPGKTILLVTHGAFLKVMMSIAVKTPNNDKKVPIVNPGSLHLLEYREEKFTLHLNIL